MLNKSKFFLGSILISLAATTVAAPVDLSTWSQNGTGNWTLSGGNQSVLQTTNTSTPAVFFNNSNSQGISLSGQISVNDSDDDFIGFVLGYNDGDSTNTNADYLLIDWKQTAQSAFSATAPAGLAISAISGTFSTTEFWGHTGAVNELQRANNLGNTGWNNNQIYDFDILFTATNVQVSVDGVLELDINGTFSDGSFGFYNFSQPNVLYSSIEADVVNTPAPGVFLLLLAGLSAMRYSFSHNKKTLS
ncbi:MAG: hypothetical protein methR_P1656 [Methyloprofundus sp.]|nr:MAG: hypothetical protein methR_P1656 [Methyloprofundus sp.]